MRDSPLPDGRYCAPGDYHDPMSVRLTRRIVIGGSAVLVAFGAVSGCTPTTEKDAPATSSPTATSSAVAPAVTPTEKAVGPGGGSFSPTVNPVPPGSTCRDIVNGVCQR